MQLFMSADMEGLPDIFYPPPQVNRSVSIINEERKLFTEFILVLASSLHNAGAEKILVSDAHGTLTNVLYKSMPSYVVLSKGGVRVLDMVSGIDRGFNGAVFLGFHSAAGTTHSNFDHTYSEAFHRIVLNGEDTSEFYICSLVAGEYDVPVIMVLGDDKLETEVKSRLPYTVYVRLKESVSYWGSVYESMETLQKRINEASIEAIESLLRGNERTPKPLKLKQRPEFNFEMSETLYADVGELIPGVERVNGYTLRVKTETVSQGFKLMQLLSYAAEGIQHYVES